VGRVDEYLTTRCLLLSTNEQSEHLHTLCITTCEVSENIQVTEIGI